MYFRMKFALFFRVFDSWYIIKYLLTVIIDSLVHKTYCFPRPQSISVKCVASPYSYVASPYMQPVYNNMSQTLKSEMEQYEYTLIPASDNEHLFTDL